MTELLAPAAKSHVESDVESNAVVWVDAAPFRAHLAHVMAVGDMSVEVVAALTGVPPGAARHLLRGRGGRPVRRISADVGQRLLRITSHDARTVRQREISSRGAAHQLREILACGLTLTAAAARSGVEVELLRELLDRRRDVCSPFVAARVTALRSASEVGDESGRPLAS